MRRSFTRGISVLVLFFIVGLSAAFASGNPAAGYPETVRTARETLWKEVTSGENIEKRSGYYLSERHRW